MKKLTLILFTLLLLLPTLTPALAQTEQPQVLAMEIEGPYNQLMRGSPLSLLNGDFQVSFLGARGGLIAAGSTEIMKNIIGERVLGLPKDMARAALTKNQ